MNHHKHYHPGMTLEKGGVASLYRFRLNNAKESGRMSVQSIRQFEATVEKLEASQSDTIGFCMLHGQYYYMIFYEPQTRMVLGILKSEGPMDPSGDSVQV